MTRNPRKTRKYASDEERRNAAYQYWLAGHTYQQVADEYGYHDRSTAYNAIAAVKRQWQAQSEEARDQSAERIIEPLLTMRRLAIETGDPQAAAQHRGYEERLAKLYGLDSPVKTDITTDGEKITIQVIPDWQGDSPQ